MAVTVTNTDSAQDNTTQTVYTFSSLSLGAADSDRIIIVTTGGRSASTITSITCTVGGTSATEAIKAANTNFSAIFAVSKPTGTTGDIVITLNTDAVRCGVGVYRVLGLSGITPFDTDAALNSSSATSLAGAGIDVNNGGLLVGSWHNSASSGVVTDWTNVTEDFTEDDGGNNVLNSGGTQVSGSDQSGLVVSCNNTGGNGFHKAIVIASWNASEIGNAEGLSTISASRVTRKIMSSSY